MKFLRHLCGGKQFTKSRKFLCFFMYTCYLIFNYLLWLIWVFNSVPLLGSISLGILCPQPIPIHWSNRGWCPFLFWSIYSVLYIRSNFQIRSRMFKNHQRSNLSKAHNHYVYHRTYVTLQESNGWPTESSIVYTHFPDKSDIHVCHLTRKIIYDHCFLLYMFKLKQLHRHKWIYLLLIHNPIDKHHLLQLKQDLKQIT